jgi:capsid protein
MGLLDFFGLQRKSNEQESVSIQPKSNVSYQDNNMVVGYEYAIVNKKWDGEKNLGELGLVVNNIPDYHRLRLRSYNAYATIDTFKTIASKYFYWKIGSGLKLQAEPNLTVLKSEGLDITDEQSSELQKVIEARFMIWANSKQSDYLKQKNLHQLASDFDKGKYLGGDNLLIVRFDDNGPNIQFVSGEFVCNPGIETEYFAKAKERGNDIKHGIEIDKDGKHIAFFVRIKKKDSVDEFERVPAYGLKSGKKLAWLVSGEKISPDHLRAVPAMSQSLEKINKLDRYVEAAVTKAEQAANIIHTIKHKEFSDGSSPLQDEVNKKRGIAVNPTIDAEQQKVLADGLANKIAQQTSGMAYNMPVGAELESFESTIETNFEGFHSTIFNGISAGANVPPEVAMQSFNSNYSASRAAINSFGYFITVDRQDLAEQFYIPIYKLWLEYQILTNKISAPKYIENIDNEMVTEAYTQCRFLGKDMPHIDPLKEAKSVELMLALKLISHEQASEMLGVGSWDENFKKWQKEDKTIPKEEIVNSVLPTKKNNNNLKN